MLPTGNRQGRRIALGDKLDLLVDVFSAGQPTHIFNTPEFFSLHAGDGRGHYFQLAERKSKAVLATLHFTETGADCYRSPARGTYGGISSASDVPLEAFEDFLRAAEDVLREEGATQTEIVLPPASHDLPQFSVCFNILTRMGYAPARQELNYDIVVDNQPLSEHMDYGNRKRLNKCLRAGFTASPLGPENYRAAFDLIAANRRRRNFPVTMAYEDIVRMSETFGDRILFFGLARDSALAAAAVCLAVSPDVLYVFYWGDADGMQEYSPVVPLAAAIYAHCQSAGHRLMDVGTSTNHGTPNHGLVRFKRSLGMRESLKLTMTKQMAGDA